MTNVFVTGATGFLGGHLARTLARRGYSVRALVRRPGRGTIGEEPGIELIEGDLARPEDVLAASAGCSTFYHIAALYRSAKEPDSVYHDVNVGGTANVLEAARRHGPDRVVHCSTIGVHGDVAEIPAVENSSFRPHDVYQRTKLEGELLARAAAREGMPVTVFRPAAIYGPGDTRFLKLFKSVNTGRFRMFGSGQILYHMTYVTDLVAGIILCGEHPAAEGETYILAGPRYTTIAELVAVVAQALGRPVPRGRLPLRPLQLAARACELICRPLGIEPPLHRRRLDFFTVNRAFSIEKARRELGYRPQVDILQGCRLTARWYRENGLLK
ncbi:MAG: NAD-dependent epimerase/dehydratase family protein [Candidatus Erginobacter occultus]|nr:NAD-dependent epimerase/dehydratase family protein [Candidatus Erginobacter occultus]